MKLTSQEILDLIYTWLDGDKAKQPLLEPAQDCFAGPAVNTRLEPKVIGVCYYYDTVARRRFMLLNS